MHEIHMHAPGLHLCSVQHMQSIWFGLPQKNKSYSGSSLASPGIIEFLFDSGGGLFK